MKTPEEISEALEAMKRTNSIMNAQGRTCGSLTAAIDAFAWITGDAPVFSYPPIDKSIETLRAAKETSQRIRRN